MSAETVFESNTEKKIQLDIAGPFPKNERTKN